MQKTLRISRIKRRIISISAILLLVFVVVPSATLAFYTTNDTATNVITAGNTRIELFEEMENEEGERVPFEDVGDAKPGGEYSKIPMIKNTGGYTAWVRIGAEVEVTLKDGETKRTDFEYANINYDTENWEFRDGYWYYLKPLKAGEVTEPVFTKAAFDREMTNEYGDCTVKIRLVGYAVQYANNGDGEGQTVFDAIGWPEGGNA